MVLLLTHLLLQQYWWILVSLLGSILVFLLFVQGGQTLFRPIAKTEEEKTLLINSLGRKWELTFTTLVTFGGAFFASFPLFYSTSFGGAYWVWFLILTCFIIQAVSYEYRKKPANFLGKKTYEVFLFINGSLGVILLGAAVSTFFTGGNFFVSDYHFSQWMNPLHGLEAAYVPTNLLLGSSVFFLARVLASLYFMNNIRDENIFNRSKKSAILNSIAFLLMFLTFLADLFLMKGYAYDPITRVVFIEDYKYFHNLMQMPVVLILFLVGVLLVLWGIGINAFKNSTKGIWFSGLGTVLTVFSLFCLAGFNHTCFYPSTYDLQSSLTIENASSSKFTLTVMSVVSLLIPFVLAYIYYVWKSMDKHGVSMTEIKSEETVY